jgi:hypothetical protein
VSILEFCDSHSFSVTFFILDSRLFCSEFVCLLFLQAHRKTYHFLADSEVQLAQSKRGQFHFLRAAFSSQIKSKVGNILTKAAALRINLNIDGAPIYHLCLLLLVRQAGYIVNLSDFYSYRLIGKLTAFLQLQEFVLHNLPVASSTSAARLSLNSSREKLAWLSLR